MLWTKKLLISTKVYLVFYAWDSTKYNFAISMKVSYFTQKLDSGRLDDELQNKVENMEKIWTCIFKECNI